MRGMPPCIINGNGVDKLLIPGAGLITLPTNIMYGKGELNEKHDGCISNEHNFNG